MYLGYAMNLNLYDVHEFLQHNYQGSRLGYIAPLHFLMENLGTFEGRLTYVVFLYSSYVFSVMIMAKYFLNTTIERMLVCFIFILNPGFSSSVFYGGADGPAAVQLLLAVSFLTCAIYSDGQIKKNALATLSGLFLILSVSSHIFAAIPCILIFPMLFYHFSAKRLILPLVFGISSTLYILNVIGYQFGLDEFYLSYSIPWAKTSLFDSRGVKLVDPLGHRIRNAVFWIPIVMTILSFRYFVPKLPSREDKNYFLILMAFINIFGPIITYSLYDILTKGNTIVTPAYFNIIYPSFVFGLVCLVSLNIKTFGGDVSNNSVKDMKRKRYSLISILLASVFFNFTSNHNQSALSYNNVNSESFFRSEIAFMERIKSGELDTKKAKFIFIGMGVEDEGNPRVYRDYWKHAPRHQDYLDSLVGLLLWDRSILLRLLPEDDFKIRSLNSHKNTPLVILGRNKNEVQRLAGAFQRFLSGYTSANAECYDDKYYPWCFIHFEYRKQLKDGLQIRD
jgi:hypothetical protein